MELVTFLLSLHVNNLETAAHFTRFLPFVEPYKKHGFYTAKVKGCSIGFAAFFPLLSLSPLHHEAYNCKEEFQS